MFDGSRVSPSEACVESWCPRRSVPFGWNCLGRRQEPATCEAVSVDARGSERALSRFGPEAREKYGEYRVGLHNQRSKQPGSLVGLASPREGPEVRE